MEVRINKTTTLALLLIVIGIALRLLPHEANFAPVGAIALFAGTVLGWRTALWLPLAIMITTDLIIGLHPTVLFTWSAFILVAAFGMLFKNQSNWVRIPAGALGSALIFFVVSNVGVWIEGTLYPLTLQGLIDCYIMALPFLKATLLADLGYATALFGLYAVAAKFARGHFALARPLRSPVK